MNGLNDRGLFYDRGTIKVVAWACVIIVVSVALTGFINYEITRKAVVDKLKSRDLLVVVDSIAGKIDGRVARAKETASMLAQDPAILQWVNGAEQDERLGGYAKTRLHDIARHYDYANSFIVSAVTNHYWAEGFQMIQVMSPSDPNSLWFFDAMKSGKPLQLNLDYNSARQDTFVFLNALMGDPAQPVGVAGVGLSLRDISRDFQKFKFGEDSRLWMIDAAGKIYLSDNLSDNGKYLGELIPLTVASRIVNDRTVSTASSHTIEYTDEAGETVDLAYQSTQTTDWKLVFQIPRRESVGLLDSIKWNTLVAGLVALIVMVFIFYFVSRRIADPLKRALLLADEMESQVRERTRELAETNRKIMDSIDYAKRLQESILPTRAELAAAFRDYFILWQPRDVVGGDFYWLRRLDADRVLFAVADCTGHGVPGALMTMAVNLALHHIVDQNHTEPAAILAELNHQIKAALHRNDSGEMTDDGLDIGICRIDRNRRLIFAGAKISLYIGREDEVTRIKGDNKSLGYRQSADTLTFDVHEWAIRPGDRFYMTTDGYLDQNGGEKDLPFGRNRLSEVIARQDGISLTDQETAFAAALREYMHGEAQRDDITIVGFTVS
ncbi:MAG: SpoIIE family protein phosphatase [Veillonellaceae bacterium]|nr:SpoIIE family protein phosphatase [Veillonellaceae bacterium]